MEYLHHFASPLGAITLSSDGDAITGLWFDGQKYDRATLGTMHKESALPVFDEADSWLTDYFSEKNPARTPLLRPCGSAFRKRVWGILSSIPYGSVMTYGEIAHKIAEENGLAHMSAQAVGGAVGHNPISLMIPCHRVIGSNGSLTGYAGGIEKKIWLLTMEKVERKLIIPQKGNAN